MGGALTSRKDRRRFLRETLGRPRLYQLTTRWEALVHKMWERVATKDEAKEFLEVDRLVDPFIPRRKLLNPWLAVGLWLVRRRARQLA